MKSPAVLNLPALPVPPLVPREWVGSRSALLWCLVWWYLNYSAKAKPPSPKDMGELVN